MAASWVLKIPRSDDSQGHILIQVSHRDGHPDLDLTLLATESEAVYKTKRTHVLFRLQCRCIFCLKSSFVAYMLSVVDQFAVRQKKVRDLRSPKYTGSDDEWESILRDVFLLKQESGISAELKKGLETVAAVRGIDDNNVLTITFRNHIDQITQKLGTLELNESEEEIQLFDWATSAVDQQRLLQEEVSALRSKSQADQTTITDLQSQLADLVKMKGEHEEQLISKFAILLNEKKLKIRNQQRILSTAKVDTKKLAQLKLKVDGLSGKSTGRKRRVETEVEADDREKDESDDFESMDVDHMPNALGSARSSRETTPETGTESEDEMSAGQPATSILAAGSLASEASRSESDTPPPPRQLPFVKKGAHRGDEPKTSKPPEITLGSDEETASEDDEL